MAPVVAAATAIGAVAGLFGSLEWDVPAGPAVVLVASGAFAVSLPVPARGHRGGYSIRVQTTVFPNRDIPT